MKATIQAVDSSHDVHLYKAELSDIKEVADYAKSMQNAGHVGNKDVWFAASVPAFILQKFLNEKKITFARFMRDQALQTHFLNSDYAAPFRVHKGKI